MNEFEKGFVAGMLAPKKKSENPYANYDDNWSYPSYWLQLPEPKENQVIMLIDNKGGTINSEESYTYIPHINIIENTKTTINWGDGSDVESISDVNESGHIYEQDKGHSSIKSKQWIVTITFDEDVADGSEYISTLQYDASSMYVLAMKIGHSKYIGNYENNRILTSCTNANLHYAKICRGEFNFSFCYAYYLRQVELNKYITSIPERAFYSNYLLETVNTENIECINKQGFEYCYRFNSNFPKLEKVCEEGLYSTKIREITDSNFPKLKTIGTRSFGNFNGATFLKKIDSNSIETIESYAFDCCFKLENVKINSVKSIGECAFNNCYSLQSVELQKCEHIGNGAFSNCYMLQTADIRKTDNVDLFGGSNNDRACTDLKKLIVPSGIEFNKVSLFGHFMYLDIQYV